jgi:hypothetical protein
MRLVAFAVLPQRSGDKAVLAAELVEPDRWRDQLCGPTHGRPRLGKKRRVCVVTRRDCKRAALRLQPPDSDVLDGLPLQVVNCVNKIDAAIAYRFLTEFTKRKLSWVFLRLEETQHG